MLTKRLSITFHQRFCKIILNSKAIVKGVNGLQFKSGQNSKRTKCRQLGSKKIVLMYVCVFTDYSARRKNAIILRN